MTETCDLNEIGKQAKAAALVLAQIDGATKNKALHLMADALLTSKKQIMAANDMDMVAARANKMPQAFLDRLLLTEGRLQDMADGLRALATLPDPIGEVDSAWYGSQNIQIAKTRVPLGVVGIIYEARPNVTADGAGICLKTGNAVILRGGSDAINSNCTVAKILAYAIVAAGLPQAAIQIVTDTSRQMVTEMMKLNQYIDVLIPRGGAGLIKNVVANATVPVIETGVGNCHIYVDDSADLAMATSILLNAKTQRPAVCNAAESLLVSEKIAATALPCLAKALQAANVEIRGCQETRRILQANGISATPATDEDYFAEYGDLIISCKVVAGVQAAIDHINHYNSGHSEAIITKDYDNARLFQKQVDAAAVYVNASTRFTDGFQFGFGAEIGISTQKLHARGPMGLREMTSIKYVINGNGQARK